MSLTDASATATASQAGKICSPLVSNPDLSLADARTERDKARKLIKQGIHPAHNRHALKASQITANANSFEAVALEWIDKSGAYSATKIALRLLLLTFVRPVELRAAEWPEFDLDRGEWRIPGARMKMRELHIVPLSRQAVELLRELHKFTGGQRWLFPNMRRPKEHMTMTTLNAALARMGYRNKFSAHGFRATASTQLNEMEYRPDVIERQLAHKSRDQVRASYNQAEYLPERRKMVQAWADYVDGLCSDADQEARGIIINRPGRPSWRTVTVG